MQNIDKNPTGWGEDGHASHGWKLGTRAPAADAPGNGEVRPGRRGLSAAVFSLLAIGTALFTAAPAQAAYVGNNYLRNWQTGLCLTAYVDDVRGVLGALASGCVGQSTGHKYQTWEPEYLYTNGNDVVQLRNIQENACINAYYAGSALYMSLEPCDSTNVDQEFLAEPGYNGSGWSQVRFEWAGDLGANECIDNNAGQEVNFETCVNSQAYGEQLWKLGL